jgi:hypothetical protein
MRYSRTGIVAVLIAAELFIASIIIVSAGGLKTFSSASTGHDIAFEPYSLPAIDAGSQPRVVIDDPDSRVVITPSDDGKIHVSDSTRIAGWGWGSRPQRVQVHQTSDGVLIERPSTPGRIVIFGFESSGTDVALPANATVEIRNSSGATLSDLTGTISAHSSDGHISATNVRSSDVTLQTSDGRIVLTGVNADKLEATTQDGSIHVSDLRVRSGSLHTSDGSITVALADAGDVTVHARTADGSVRVNGVRQDDLVPGDYKLGNGAGSLDVATQDGSIRVTTNGAN